MAKPKKNRNVTPATMGKHYRDKKKVMRKDGTVHAGPGKVRPHHAKIGKGNKPNTQFQQGGGEKIRHEADRKLAEQTRLHQTPNRYQSEAKKVSDDGAVETYEWMEDNGHEDHVQVKRVQRIKDEERMPLQFGGGSPKYKKNYDEIFGNKKRGVERKGGYKKTRKVYK